MDAPDHFVDLTKQLLDVATEMKDTRSIRECVELCARLGININENDIDHDLNKHKEKCEHASQGSNKEISHKDETNTRNHTYKITGNPLYDHGNDKFAYTHVPPKHQYNPYNNFTYQNQFQPRNQFPHYNNMIQNHGNFFQGVYGLMNIECIRQFNFQE